MTREETLDILVVMQAAYPNFYRNMTKQQAASVVDLWATMFAEDSLETVAYAVKAYIVNDKKGFPPYIGAIKEAILKLQHPDEMTEMEAWGYVRKAIGNGIHGAKKEFEALPPIIQRLVGSPNQLREWAVMDEDTVASVVASNFQRSYRARAAHERELLALPSDVRQAMERISEGFKMPALETPREKEARFEKSRQEMMSRLERGMDINRLEDMCNENQADRKSCNTGSADNPSDGFDSGQSNYPG